MKINIEIDAAGQLRVTGDAVLQNKIAVLGMIELAKSAVLQAPAQQPGIEVPSPSLANRLVGQSGQNGTGHGG